ncbi:winged helix-turn-helix domain-containing protein [Streptosporangium sp. NPDC049644]|uniref:ArsR/SmtB family transcription factor n=1 Tax=Streptosporangium sp. NPDC049644 TaxID=3155507 RepID=UPI003427B482
MMRLHFTAADLAQITLAPTANALLETVLTARRRHIGPTAVRRSRSGGRGRSPDGLSGTASATGVLNGLVAEEGYFPDFLLQPSISDLVDGIESVTQTAAEQFEAGLRPLSAFQRADPWVEQLAAGSVKARRTLAGELDACFTSSLAPVWGRIQRSVTADRSFRAETLLRGGVDALLATLHPGWRWEAPTLHIPSPVAYDVGLCGRGLLLVPSYLTLGPLLTYRPGRSTVLVYPVVREDRPADSAADVLGPLLGHTRAAVLAALRDPATTTALAERVGVSPASISQHTTVLRNAGLVSTTRIGAAVLHSLTPMGAALLHEGSGSSRTILDRFPRALSG